MKNEETGPAKEAKEDNREAKPINHGDLLQYRQLFLDVEDKQIEFAQVQIDLKAAEMKLNRHHQEMEKTYGHWLGRDEVDMQAGVIRMAIAAK